MFQSTHPRGVRPPVPGGVFTGHVVSIHAPAWGATRMFQSCPLYGPVSIHAPAWGATHDLAGIVVTQGRFQSTHPRGVRPGRAAPSPSRASVSIHAPAWGATAEKGEMRARLMGFNPRTRVGCDAVWQKGGASAPVVSIHAPAWGATVSMFYPVDSRD